MYKKKIFNASLYHELNFGNCPDKQHSHSTKIKLTGKGNLESFFIDPIIPCDTDSIENFLDIIFNECKNAEIILASAEIFIEDLGVSYIKFFNVEDSTN